MRTTVNVTITDEGRDKSKVFVITEMSSNRATKWAMKVFLALANSGAVVDDSAKRAGFAGLATMGWEAFGQLRWDVAEPLYDEMIQCVQIMPDPTKPNVIRPLIDDDIEEIPTQLKLRKEVFDLHTGFLKAEQFLKSTSEKPSSASSNTPTSRTVSRPSSQQVRHR